MLGKDEKRGLKSLRRYLLGSKVTLRVLHACVK